jgi:hypothetical protein
MLGLLGALLREDHEVTSAWIEILRWYERVKYVLHHYINLEHRGHLGPALCLFHIQLILRDWLKNKTRTRQLFAVPAPDFAQHIEVFEQQNNLYWLHSVYNVPALLALRNSTPRLPTAAPRATVAAPTERRAPSNAAAPAREHRDVGPRMRNPRQDVRFTGNPEFAKKVRECRVDDAMTAVGGTSVPPPM